MQTIKVKRALTIHERDCIPHVTEFVQKMFEAADKDVVDFNQGQPMLRKMKLLPEARLIMEKSAFAAHFVTNEGCRALGMWLARTPSGELPNLELRSNLLRCCSRLPITKEALANCGEHPLGARVKDLAQDPRETVTNRKIAALLIQKWLKQILSQKTHSFEIGNEEEIQGTIPRRPVETIESLAAAEAESLTRRHPRVPVIEGKDYRIHPISRDQPTKRDKFPPDSIRGKLHGALEILSRPNKKSWRPYHVSIEGRQVNIV